ncbi:hypothetical protein ABZZ74_08205 [Streptomyces sp. NPDC006476]|uniref:hypothetical protein n=1 Tax=Streptomyces sp. NPDC006476 TaxID=3157175 RepID=UPI0033BE2913
MNVSGGTYVNHGVDADDATDPTGRTTYEDTTAAPRTDSGTGAAVGGVGSWVGSWAGAGVGGGSRGGFGGRAGVWLGLRVGPGGDGYGDGGRPSDTDGCGHG